MLSHLIPGTLPDEDWLEHARKNYGGPATVGHDLMRIAGADRPMSAEKEQK